MIAPPITPNAIAYAWDRLWDIAGADELDTPRIYGPADAALPRPGVIIIPASPDAWRTLLQRHDRSLDWLPAEALFPPGYPRPFDDSLPILFGGDAPRENPPVWMRADGSIVFQIDFLSATLFMLTRWEEIVLPDRDEHDRFPAAASVAFRQGFLDQPIIDRYAIILRAWLHILRPGWTPPRPHLHLRLSHDIDHLRRFRSTNEAIRQTARDLLRRHRLDRFGEDMRDFALGRLWLTRNPYLTAIDHLAQISEDAGLRSVFYIMAAEPGDIDEGFDPATPALLHRLHRLADAGHIVGFHPGYDAYRDARRYQSEKTKLETILGKQILHARQHYLRFQVPETWRIAQESGILEDATLGYPDHVGFRCGTSHPFPVFDILENRELTLVEHPLHVMDGTLRRYQELTPVQSLERLRFLARRVAEVGGDFHLLWHNIVTTHDRRPWFDVYRQFIYDYSRNKFL